MASYVPAKYGTEYIFYVGLESVATAGTFQANATLASGDVKLSKNGGTLTNLTTLPTVTPASGKLIKVTLSATEMECDNATVIFSDASGGEWRDLIVNIQTATRQIDDLAYGTVSANMVQISGDTTAADNAESFFDGTGYAGTGNVIPTVTAAGLADGAITAAKIAADAITAAKLAADVTTEIQSGLLTSTAFDTKIGNPAGASLAADVAAVKSDTAATLTDTAEIGTAGAGLTALASATNLATLAGYVDTEVAAIKAKTDNLPADPADASDIAASLATITGYIDTEIAAILAAVDTEVAAIKAVTDNLPNSGALTTITNNIAAILADTGTDGVALADGAITAAKIAANAIAAAEIATDALQAIADAVLARSRSNVDSTASTDSLYELIGAILDGSTATGSLVVKRTDGVTTFNTRPLDTDPDAIPIVGVGG